MKSDYNQLNGTSHLNRMTKYLMPDTVDIDGRSIADMLSITSEYAKLINLYDLEGNKENDWSEVFNKDISIFLANIMTFRLDVIESELQRITFDLGDQALNSNDKAIDLLKDLLKLTLRLLLQVNDWYIHSFNLRNIGQETEIELIIERSILSKLSEKTRKLYAYILSMPELLEVWNELNCSTSFHKIWDLNYNTSITLMQGNSFEDQILYASKELRMILRNTILTTAYIINQTPFLLEKSIFNKNNHQPDIGLFITFLRLFKKAQNYLNKVTKRHLDYYYQDVLGLQAQTETSSQTYVHFRLSEQFDAFHLKEGTLLNAGINSSGESSTYQTDETLIVNPAKIVELKSIFLEQNPAFGVGSSYKLISNIYTSTVRVGENHQLYEDEEIIDQWKIFGEDQMNIDEVRRQMEMANLGLIISSSVLHLKEGFRKIRLEINFVADSKSILNRLLQDLSVNKKMPPANLFTYLFNNAFHIELSSEKGWISIENYNVYPSEDVDCIIEFGLDKEIPSIVHYDKELHGENYDYEQPIMRVMLKTEDTIFAYAFLKDLKLSTIKIQVEVEDLQSHDLYNEDGLVDDSGPFPLFSAAPQKGSYLLIGNSELFNKDIESLQIVFDWHNLSNIEKSFEEYYKAYKQDIGNDSFKIGISALSQQRFYPTEDIQERHSLFQASEDGLEDTTSIDSINLSLLQLQKDYQLQQLLSYGHDSRLGFYKITLLEPKIAFGLKEFPKLFAETALNNSQTAFFNWGKSAKKIELPNEPFVPLVKKININYKASTTLHFETGQAYLNNLEKKDRYAHLTPFGIQGIDYGKTTPPSIFPFYESDACLYIGMQNIEFNQVISLYFDLDESTERVEKNNLKINWTYLENNIWKQLDTSNIISDGTLNFTHSGIIKLSLPIIDKSKNTLMSNDTYWLRVDAKGSFQAVGFLKRIVPNVVSATWKPNENGPTYTSNAMLHPIEDLVSQVPSIQSISQVSSFFNIINPESTSDFYLRVSERLRHKNRAIDLWDYEHLILEEFEHVCQVRCLSNTHHPEFIEAGEVKIIAIPHSEAENLHPKLGYHQLQDIQHFIQKRTSPFTKIHIMNPVYEPIVINANIVFLQGNNKDDGKYLNLLYEKLKHFLCPWLKNEMLIFDLSIKQTDILDFIKSLPFVSFVSGFSIGHIYKDESNNYLLNDTAIKSKDSEFISASTPWSILVPANQHSINILTNEEYQPATPTTLDNMRLGTDFIIGTANLSIK